MKPARIQQASRVVCLGLSGSCCVLCSRRIRHHSHYLELAGDAASPAATVRRGLETEPIRSVLIGEPLRRQQNGMRQRRAWWLQSRVCQLSIHFLAVSVNQPRGIGFLLVDEQQKGDLAKPCQQSQRGTQWPPAAKAIPQQGTLPVPRWTRDGNN